MGKGEMERLFLWECSESGVIRKGSETGRGGSLKFDLESVELKIGSKSENVGVFAEP